MDGWMVVCDMSLRLAGCGRSWRDRGVGRVASRAAERNSSLEGCESEAVRGEARRDEIRCSRDEATEARRAE